LIKARGLLVVIVSVMIFAENIKNKDKL